MGWWRAGLAGRPAGAALPARRDAGRGFGRGSVLSPRRVPSRLPGLVDSHCHLQDPAFDTDRGDVLERAILAGVERLLVPGYDLASSRRARDLAREHPELIRAAAGIHPHFAAEATEADWAELGELAESTEIVAVGEIGLDYFRKLSPPDVQRRAFDRQLALAAGLGKPVLVHDREAHDDIRAGLLGWPGPGRHGERPHGVLHAFSGDAPMALELAAAGYLISFALPLTFGSASGPRAAAGALPAGSFLVETDSPWLAPGGAGTRNEPTTAIRVAVELGRLRGVPPEVIATEVRGAYDRLLGG